MVEHVARLATVFANYFGLALLALRQRPHWRAVSPPGESSEPCDPPRDWLAAVATLHLCASFGASWIAAGPSFGSLYWVLTLGCAGIAVTFTLSWRPHWLTPLQRVAR